MQADIKRAEIMVQNLKHNKETLKTALASVVHKKDELYKILLEYKNALEKMNTKYTEAEAKLEEIELVKDEIQTVKHQLIRRDEKIKSLYNKNLTLEKILEEKGLINKPWENSYKSVRNEDTQSNINLEKAADLILNKIKSNSIYHKIFKECAPCVNYFKDLIEQGKYEEALLRLCNFVNVLLKDEEKQKFIEISPEKSEIQQLITSVKSSRSETPFNQQYENEEYDDDSIDKLKLEIEDNLSKSKETLLNKRLFSHIKNEKSSKEPVFGKKNKEKPYKEEDDEEKYEKNDDQEKKIIRPRQQIRIFSRRDSKSDQSLPKPSILKRPE